MKKILMIGTGGTIASEMTPEGLTPELSSRITSRTNAGAAMFLPNAGSGGPEMETSLAPPLSTRRDLPSVLPSWLFSTTS